MNSKNEREVSIIKEYTIYRLEDGEYDAFLLCLTFESILNYLRSIEDEIMVSETKGVLLIDQLLVTGNGKNRFMRCPFDHGILDVNAAQNVIPSEYYKILSVQLLQQNYALLENSILTDQQKCNVKKGIAF